MTDKAKLYAVKNDEGKWLGCEIYCDEPDWFDHCGFIWDIRSIAEENVKLYGGHVVELVEAPANVVVREEAVAKILREAKRYADDYISEDKLELEIKMALSAYKPAGVSDKLVVSDEEADFLSGVSHDTCVSAAAQIRAHFNKNTWSKVCEDRLMRAYVNGWAVEKPKRYFVRVPHTEDVWYYKSWNGSLQAVGQANKELVGKFTESEIEHYGL